MTKNTRVPTLSELLDGITDDNVHGEIGLVSREHVDDLIERLDGMTGDDPEAEHLCADRLLCGLLCTLGYSHVVDAYRKIARWYS